MRALLPALLLALFLGALLWVGPGTAWAADKAPAGLKELGERLAKLDKRVEALLAEARKDPDERKIEEYRQYTPAQLKKTRGRVRAKDLVEFMLDPKKNPALRKKAMEAIHEGGAIRNDPELSTTEKQGPRTKRAYFCKTQLVKNLKHENRVCRDLTNLLLTRFWPINQRNHAEMKNYDVDKEDTWKDAISGWNKYLSKN